MQARGVFERLGLGVVFCFFWVCWLCRTFFVSRSRRQAVRVLEVLDRRRGPANSGLVTSRLGGGNFGLNRHTIECRVRVLSRGNCAGEVKGSKEGVAGLNLRGLRGKLVCSRISFVCSEFRRVVCLASFGCVARRKGMIMGASAIRGRRSVSVVGGIARDSLSIDPCIGLGEIGGSSGVRMAALYKAALSKMLLGRKVPSRPGCKKLLGVRSSRPVGFARLVSCGGASMSPLSTFSTGKFASVVSIVRGNSKVVPTGFELVPRVKHRGTIGVVGGVSGVKVNKMVNVSSRKGSVLKTPMPGKVIKVIMIKKVAPFYTIRRRGRSVRVEVSRRAESFGALSPVASEVGPMLGRMRRIPEPGVSFLLSGA